MAFLTPHVTYSPDNFSYLETVRDISCLEMDKAMWRALCRESVDRGAAVARKVNKKWAKILDTESFQISSGASCVIAQLAKKDMKRFRSDLLDVLNYERFEDDGPLSVRQQTQLIQDAAGYETGLEVLRRNKLADGDRSEYDLPGYQRWEQWHGFIIEVFPFDHVEYVDQDALDTNPDKYKYFSTDDHWAILQECWIERIAVERGDAVLVNV